MVTLRTERLILRRWRHSDREPYARLNADSRTREFMPSLLSHAESDLLIDRSERHFRQHGFGRCATELAQNGSLIGSIGLAVPAFSAAFTPCVEIGWRLFPDYGARALHPKARARSSATPSRFSASNRLWRSPSPRTCARVAQWKNSAWSMGPPKILSIRICQKGTHCATTSSSACAARIGSLRSACETNPDLRVRSFAMAAPRLAVGAMFSYSDCLNYR
jgi:hypothetical protein